MKKEKLVIVRYQIQFYSIDPSTGGEFISNFLPFLWDSYEKELKNICDINIDNIEDNILIVTGPKKIIEDTFNNGYGPIKTKFINLGLHQK